MRGLGLVYECHLSDGDNLMQRGTLYFGAWVDGRRTTFERARRAELIGRSVEVRLIERPEIERCESGSVINDELQ